jgi:hypothetical protein
MIAAAPDNKADALPPKPVPMFLNPAGHLAQVVGQQPAAPQRTVHPNLVGIQVGDPGQLLLPPRRVVGRLARVGLVRHRVGPAGQVAVQDAADGVGAAPDQLGDLGWVWPWALSRTIW